MDVGLQLGGGSAEQLGVKAQWSVHQQGLVSEQISGPLGGSKVEVGGWEERGPRGLTRGRAKWLSSPGTDC